MDEMTSAYSAFLYWSPSFFATPGTKTDAPPPPPITTTLFLSNLYSLIAGITELIILVFDMSRICSAVCSKDNPR